MSRTTLYLAVLCAAALPPSLIAQNIHPTPGPEARAVQLQGEIHLDGKLDEAIWRTAPPATDFRQNQPHEGQSATQRTEVRFVFDGAALYVGARMFEDSGARGVHTRLARRDADISTDYLQVIFDTYHDHIGRLFFLVNPSGVKQDANGLGGGGDPSWDPVWEVKTNIDSLGWTAEIRIPFSQLRFPSTAAEQTCARLRDRLARLHVPLAARQRRAPLGIPARFDAVRGVDAAQPDPGPPAREHPVQR